MSPDSEDATSIHPFAMCPLYPFHFVLLYLCLLLPLLFAVVECSEELSAWAAKVKFNPAKLDVKDQMMQYNGPYNRTQAQIVCRDCPLPQGQYITLDSSYTAHSA